MNRPTSVTVFGVLNIIFGALGLLSIVFSAAMFFAPQPDMSNPAIRIFSRTPILMLWMKVGVVLGSVTSVAVLASGIGLLQLRPWARTASIIYGVYAIIMGMVGTVINYLFLFGPLMEEAQHSRGPEAAGAIGGAIGGVAGGLIGLIYPVLLLVFMYRPNVVAAFSVDEPQSGPYWQ